ncbi:MAG TPA: Trk system potassium transporter TrkA [Planctomycetota bacterium]|nr:Trk system potassium transporter TrkA [Planctomycetota bacterium]
MRIVVFSSGTSARQLAAELSSQDDVTILHSGHEGRDELEKLDVEVLTGEGNDADALRKAHADEADYLVACSKSDEMNLLACLTARQLGATKTICFIAKEEYARTFGATDGGSGGGAPALGIDHLIWPARMLAEKIERILTVPGAVDAGRFAQGRVALLEYKLRPDGPLVGRPLASIGNLPPGVLMAGVRRGEEWFVPRGQSVLLANDRVVFMGRSDAMHQLAGFFAGHRKDEGSEAVIIGGGTVGLRLARSLEANPRARLKLIEKSPERCAEAAQVLARTLVLQGDGCDLDLLEDEDVRHAGTLVAVTDSDEKNLLASLLGRQLGVPKIITRVSSAANRRLFERVGIDVPLSARASANEAVLHLIRHREADLLATIGQGAGEVLEITLPARFTPVPLKEVSLPPDVLIATILRKSEVIVPGGATLLAPQDHCLVICRVERVADVLKTLLQ